MRAMKKQIDAKTWSWWVYFLIVLAVTAVVVIAAIVVRIPYQSLIGFRAHTCGVCLRYIVSSRDESEEDAGLFDAGHQRAIRGTTGERSYNKSNQWQQQQFVG